MRIAIVFGACGLVLLTQTRGLAAQNSQESSLGRARMAAALRDTLLRIHPDLATAAACAGVRVELRGFLSEPYVGEAPTLGQLDEALAWANAARASGDDCPRSGTTKGRAEEGTIGGGATGVGQIASAGAGLTGLPGQAQLLVGVTDFMVERARDEVAFAFLLQLRNRTAPDSHLKTLAPHSFDLVQRLNAETYQTLFPTLRSAFARDLEELPARLDGFAAGNPDSTYLRGLALVYRRGVEIRDGAPPALALSNLARVTATEMTDRSVRRGLVVVGLLAREYAASGGEPLLQELAQDSRGWMRRYLLAFVANELATRLEGSDRLEVLRFAATREADAVALLNQLHTLSRQVASLPALADTLSGERREAAIASRALAVAGGTLQVLALGQRFVPEATEGSALFRRSVERASALTRGLIQKDYRVVAGLILEEAALRVCPETSTELNPSQRAAACDRRMKYLSFGASLASAQSAGEVTAVLRQASAPVGTYLAVRNQYDPVGGQTSRWGPWSASVVGYLGIGAGLEHAAADVDDPDALYAGAALPVGLQVSRGFPGGALSLFVPIVDLGTLASVRLQGGDAESADPTFRQVFAPGMFAVWNISRTLPISFGVGARVVPGLRERDDERVDVFQWSTFLGIDANLFHVRF